MKKLILLVTCAFSGILYSQNNLDISESYVTNFLPLKQGKEFNNFESDEYYHDYEEQKNFEVDDNLHESEQPTLHEEQNNLEYPHKEILEYSGPNNIDYPDQENFGYADQEDHFDTNEEQSFQDQRSLDIHENQKNNLKEKKINDETYSDGHQAFQYVKKQAFTEENLYEEDMEHPDKIFYDQDSDFSKDTFYNKELEHPEKIFDEKKAKKFQESFKDEELDNFKDVEEENDISLSGKITGFFSILAKTAGNVQFCISEFIPGFILSNQVKEIDDFEDNDYYYDFEVDDHFHSYEDPLQYEQQNYLDNDNFKLSDQEDYFKSNKEYFEDSSSLENYENQETNLKKKELNNENYFRSSLKESQSLQKKKQPACTEEKLYEKDPKHREENVFNDNLDYSVETLDEKQLKHPKEGFHKKDQENFEENF